MVDVSKTLDCFCKMKELDFANINNQKLFQAAIVDRPLLRGILQNYLR